MLITTFLIVLVGVAVASGVIYCIYWIGKVRQAKEQVALIAREMEIAEFESSEKGNSLQNLGEALAALNLARLTAKKFKAYVDEMMVIPVPDIPTPQETSEDILRRVTDILQKLNEHSAALAGAEMLILNALNIADGDMILRLVLTSFAGAIPESYVEATKQLLEQIITGNFEHLDALQSGAADIIHGLIHLYQTNPTVLLQTVVHMEIGDFFYIIHNSAYQEVFHHGLLTLVESMQHADTAISAVDHMQHLDHLGTGAGHLDHLTGFDVHFPIITFVLSTSREATLHRDGKTDLETSLKNISLDVAGTGIGAAIGSIIVGFIVPGFGHLIGAMAGGFLGRITTNSIKEQPLREAIEEFKATAEMWKTGELQAAQQAGKEAYRKVNEKNQQLALQINAPPILDDRAEQQLIRDVERFRMEAAIYLQDARKHIERAKRLYNSLFIFFFPERELFKRQLTLLENRVLHAELLLPSVEFACAKPLDAMDELFRTLIPLSSLNQYLESSFLRINTRISSFNQRLAIWYQESSSICRAVSCEVEEIIAGILKTYKQTCEELLDDMSKAQAKVKEKADALGRKTEA